MKKEKIFINKIEKKLHNNQKISEIKNENIDIVKDNEIIDVTDKINKLFNTNGYLFNIKVRIITNHKEYHTKIAGKINNHLITMDNDIINIDDIKDIIIID